MLEKLKEYWNKYKKYIIAILILIMGVFLLNFIFVITDWIAGKGFNWKAILYSPVSNEEWLSFIGNGIVGLATLLLFWIAKKSFENERNKVKYENEMKKIEKEKEIVEEYLNTLDINEVYNLVTLTFGTSFQKDFKSDKEIMKNIISSRIELVKCITLTKIKLNCNTNFKVLIKRNSLENEEEDCDNKKYKSLEKNINDKLNYLYVIHTKIFEKIFKKIIKATYTNSLKERNEEINSIFSIKDSQISNLFSKIYKKYEKNLSDTIKLQLEKDINKGDYRYPFYICLDLIIDELIEYFDKREKDVEEEFKKVVNNKY